MKKPQIDIQRLRRDNYVTHFESRQQVKAMDESQVARVKNIAEVIRTPNLNEYGCDDYTDAEWNEIINMANMSGVPATLCIRWYHSDKDWDNFLVKWNNLPDVGRETFQELILDKKKLSTVYVDELEKSVDNSKKPVDKNTTYPHYPQVRNSSTTSSELST